LIPEYANRAGMYMHTDAYQSFLKMHEAATRDGINLVIISAFRDFNHQKRIWENKWNGRQYYTEIKSNRYCR
jgi:zinc D-Ala-D-Ala carboxypeptidase